MALWSPTQSSLRAHNQLDPVPTFLGALQEQGLTAQREFIQDNRALLVGGQAHTVPNVRQGYDTALAVFGADADPTQRPKAILCTDDMMA